MRMSETNLMAVVQIFRLNQKYEMVMLKGKLTRSPNSLKSILWGPPSHTASMADKHRLVVPDEGLGDG